MILRALSILLLTAPVWLSGSIKWKIKGGGFFRNTALERQVEGIYQDEFKTERISAALMEDVLWTIQNGLADEGYLDSLLFVDLIALNGDKLHHQWKHNWDRDIDSNLELTGFTVGIGLGPQYVFNSVKVIQEGLLKEDTEDYFYKSGSLINQRSASFFSEDRLESGVARIKKELKEEGYLDAEVSVQDKTLEASGLVNIELLVQPGKPYRIQELVTFHEDIEHERILYPYQGYPINQLIEDAEQLKQTFYQAGHPNAQVNYYTFEVNEKTEWIEANLALQVTPGPQVKRGEVRFEEATGKGVKAPVGKRFLPKSEVIQRKKLEALRNKLTRLGKYQTVALSYDKASDVLWNPVYTLTPKDKLTVSGLAGYSSYEQFRTGVIVDTVGLPWAPHLSSTKAVVSMKSYSVDSRYTIPEFYFDYTQLFFEGNYLKREEISFDRREIKGSVGLSKRFSQENLRATLQYHFEDIEVDNLRIVDSANGTESSQLGSLEFTLQQNRLNNLLYPAEGYQWYSGIKVANPVFGGSQHYQKLTLGGTYHKPLMSSWYLHSAAKMGYLATWGGNPEELPVNERFLNGGESTVRGFRQGEASTRNSEGKVIGSGHFFLSNVEVEQKLLDQLSVFEFVDSISFGRKPNSFSSDRWMHSVGVGLSYKTPVGPLRLTYGYNLNPRPEDSKYRVHFSLGYPF